MFISKIRIKNFRCFDDTTVKFNEGLNIIIGENNSGKTTIFKALQLIFNRTKSKQFTVDDFFKGLPIDTEGPPEISATVTLQSSGNDSVEDRAVVASWLTKLESSWEATLTYIYFLPEVDAKDFKDSISMLRKKNSPVDREEYWDMLESFLPKYVSRIYGGNIESKNRAEPEYLDKFDCEILDAIRDVESKMFTGQNVLLKEVLMHFLDYGLKESEEEEEIKNQQRKFNEQAESLLNGIISRISTEDILTLAKQTGASIGGIPGIDGKLDYKDIISALKLIIKNADQQIPITNNGLGYNNLIFISLILSKLRMVTHKRLGDNAKIFPFLLIEEPEAHLHPAMQYKFIKFLQDEVKNKTVGKKISRQIFITSHSTHITSAVSLNSIICMVAVKDNNVEARYPGKVFSDSKEDVKSKKYVERYLDATKSTMLFSKGVILVEGLAEQLLLPCFAEYIKCPLEQDHVTSIRVDGLTFKHFVKLFGAGIPVENKKYALPRRLACIVDTDPKRKSKGEKGARWKSCWPFELDIDKDKYEYSKESGVISDLKSSSKKEDNVKIFYNKSGKSKTFEYDLAFENYKYDFWLPDGFSIIDDNEDLNKALAGSNYDDEDTKKARLAASYLLSVSKGENAFDLEKKLREQLDDEKKEFKIPEFIIEAIHWPCGKTGAS